MYMLPCLLAVLVHNPIETTADNAESKMPYFYNNRTCGTKNEDFENVFKNLQARTNSYRDAFWPEGVVHYQFDENVNSTQRSVIQSAIDHFDSKTCIRWLPRSGQQAYVHFKTDFRPGFCGGADACRKGGHQMIDIAPDCYTLPVAVHEMLHALCFIHEQERNDRDEFLSFEGCSNPSKIPPIIPGQINNGGLYDYVSQLHYMCYDSCAGLPKMTGVLANQCGSSENTEGLSVLDVDKVNNVYNCQEPCMTHRWYNTNNISAAQWDQLVNFGDPDQSQIYMCRSYNGRGEISTGWYDPEFSTCYVRHGYTMVEAKDHVQLFALPSGQKLTNTSSPYRLINESQYTWKPSHPLVQVGRDIDNYKIYFATYTGGPGYDTNVKWMGKLYEKFTVAMFVNPDQKPEPVWESPKFYALACFPE